MYVTHIETSGRERRQDSTVTIERAEKAVSHRCKMSHIEASAWEAFDGSFTVEPIEEVVSRIVPSRSKEGHFWHRTEKDLGCGGSDLGHERVSFRGRPPSGRVTRQGEGDEVGSRGSVGLGHPRQEVAG